MSWRQLCNESALLCSVEIPHTALILVIFQEFNRRISLSLLAEFGEPITRVENALQALREGRGVLLPMRTSRERRRHHLLSRTPNCTLKWRL